LINKFIVGEQIEANSPQLLFNARAIMHWGTNEGDIILSMIHHIGEWQNKVAIFGGFMGPKIRTKRKVQVIQAPHLFLSYIQRSPLQRRR
jgi:hypothetical protein